MDESEQTMRRYLLGELSEPQQSALEEKYFADPEVFNQILKAESELVDGYVRDNLPMETRAQFEQSYMVHPSRNERVKFAAALANRLGQVEVSEPVSEPSPVSWWQRLLDSLGGQRPGLRLSVALATVIIMLGGVSVLIVIRRSQREAAQVQLAQAEQQRREREISQQAANEGNRANEPAANQGAVEPSPSQIRQPEPRSVALALTVGGVRGGGNGQTPTLIIPADANQARLLLNLKENDYPSYNASLQRVAGAEIFSQRGVRPARVKTGASFVFTVPAGKLESGDYVLTLRGVNPDGEVDELSKSLFRVVKR
jgi:anti-sigma factor RsiW